MRAPSGHIVSGGTRHPHDITGILAWIPWCPWCPPGFSVVKSLHTLYLPLPIRDPLWLPPHLLSCFAELGLLAGGLRDGPSLCSFSQALRTAVWGAK